MYAEVLQVCYYYKILYNYYRPLQHIQFQGILNKLDANPLSSIVKLLQKKSPVNNFSTTPNNIKTYNISIQHFKHMDKFLINSQTMSQPVKIDKVQGLILVNDFISKENQKQLITHINQSQWNLSLKRRTQHYGYEYRYDRKNQISQTQPLPQWSLQIKHKIQQYLNQHTELFSLKKQQEENPHEQMTFDQLIINEYQPGQGINPHIDNVKLFDEPIVSLSLGSECMMELDREISNEKGQHEDETVEVLLKRRSLAVLTGDARYKWKHSIPARKKDNGKPRTIRCSMTWRIMNNQILNSHRKQIQTKPTNQTDL